MFVHFQSQEVKRQGYYEHLCYGAYEHDRY